MARIDERHDNGASELHVRQRAALLYRAMRERTRYLVLFCCIAVGLVMGVGALLAQRAISVSYDEAPEGIRQAVDFAHARTEAEEDANGTVRFESDEFSPFVILNLETISAGYITADGASYTVKVSYSADAEIPEGCSLEVAEIPSETGEYDEYLSETEQALGWQTGSISYARFFDIKIVKDGREIQPAEGSTVSVEISLDDKDEETETQVVHFGDTTEVLAADAEGDTVSFDTSSFSVYAIVEAPDPVTVGAKAVVDLSELADGVPFYLSYNGTAKYLSNEVNAKGALVEVGSELQAAEWFFEPIEGGAGDQFYLYTLADGAKLYLKNTKGNEIGLSSAGGTALTLSPSANDTFLFKSSAEDKWLQHSGSGNGFRFWTDAKNAGNSRVTITYASSYQMERDPYGLDGSSFGIAYHDDDVYAVALSAQAKVSGSNNRLASQQLLVRPDILSNEGILLVAQDSSITQWTFESVTEDMYYLKTIVDGVVRYLTIDGGNVTLRETPDTEKSRIRVIPGTGAQAGRYQFSVGNRSLNLAGSAADGFNAVTGTGDKTWLSLVERSTELNDEDFVSYSARKVSVSNTDEVTTGSKVILYTRIWNEDKKRYDFYAVDHDGSLIRVYESGDVIQWIGGSINTAVWNFTDYPDSGGGSSYYYELQNAYTSKYLAPQIKGGQVFSNDTIGLNLNGRRYGDDYTTIIAWDDPYYEYAGIKVEDGAIASCPLAQAQDFYFAIVDTNEDDHLTTVDTVDSSTYGITMKMVDFNNRIVADRDSGQSAFFGRDSNSAGLLTSYMTDGYPSTTSKAGQEAPLSDLFTGMTEVNHLFLKGTYEESGYFEYDSTQNFAHLNDDGTFTVYDQLGYIAPGTGPTRTHGQFMPYNDLVEGRFATVTNQTTVDQQTLPDTDPRKGERMYLIPANEADYFFGMELGASFTQTPSGLDAWGHDIIFEFSGDDDFWLYVDGTLVLDLGGVHSAMTGSVNFRTGTVTSSRGNTTLRELFKKSYMDQHPGATNAEVTAYLDGIFKDGGTVFKDYTNHNMKVFYMERGAGASNLHMRFNIAAAKPGTVVLSKTISGTDREDYDLAEFAYQVWYKTKADGGSTYHLLEEKDGTGEDAASNATYYGKSTPVKFAPSYTPAGATTSYDNVFFLKPGQSAEIQLPDDALSYKIVECGINPTIYDKVTANDAEIEGMDPDGDNRTDYETSDDTIGNRPRVTYDNHVNPNALRTLTATKRLYAEDGTTELTSKQDATTFTFRLYLGSENDDKLSLANMHPYLVKDPNGNYCRWDSNAGKFVSLGKTSYKSLTKDERQAATFSTSINGSISKIPAQYTVEVRDLVVGAKFRLEERDSDLPAGYTRKEYRRVQGSYIVEGEDEPNSGIIRDNSDPSIEVCNQRGWGLTARKQWSDTSFMDAHDPIYMAVYVDGRLLDDTVRQLGTGKETLYWFFDKLERGSTFAQYEVREVTIDGDFDVDDKGVVSGFAAGAVEPIDDGGILTIGGTPKGEDHQDGFSYVVLYTPGDETGSGHNVRTDVVTNTRSGIRLVKRDWEGKALADATFSLADANGDPVGAGTYTSDDEGLITIAYLADGTYTLTETGAPARYRGLTAPLTLTIADGGVEVAGAEADRDAYELEEAPNEPDGMPTVTVRDRTFALRAVKVDEGGNSLEGAHFELYRQVEDSNGNLRKDYSPLPGYEDLASDADGLIAEGLERLPVGTYYLVETQAPKGYGNLAEDIILTIGQNGIVTVEDGVDRTLEETVDDGVVTYTLSIVNVKGTQKVRFKKVDVSNLGLALAGAQFDLYRTVDGERDDEALYAGLTSGKDGMLALHDGASGEVVSVFELGVGTYELIETTAPAGYNMKAEPVVVTVSPDGVFYEEGTSISSDNSGREYDATTNVYTLLITNEAGFELPKTGGSGTTGFYAVGATLIVAALVTLMLRIRKPCM